MPAIKGRNYRNLIIVNICFSALLFVTSNCSAGYGEFQINCPYWYIWFDRAGYVDLTYWYESPRHNTFGGGDHEMMTGDLAAACWYQNINEDNKAEWLTDSFVWPNFGTGTPFRMGNFNVYNDPCNPVWTDPCQPNPSPYNPGTKSDSGWSEVNDIVNGGKLQVKIFYEVVDLGEQDANGVGGSPISFRDANNNPVYVYSERYVLLLTYVFKNPSTTSDINGLEFYQIMHGHPANMYSNLAGCYEAANFTDPLENYTPCDSNHQTGNFKYDITLWNTVPPPYWINHYDWMSFSSTIEPNIVDFNEFQYWYSAMRYDIENRNLNGRTSWQNNDMAGAAKWNLGNLSPGQTKSITLALMYGVGPIQTEPPIPSSDADFNNDGIVNFFDFAVIAKSWKTSTGNADYNDICDLHNDGTIDYKDLDIFCKDWLWQPGQEQSDPLKMMGSGVGQGMTQSLGFTDVRYLTEQPQPVLEPQLQPELQSEPEPQSQYEPSYDTQVLIDWLEELWLTDEEVRSASTEAEWLKFIETVRQTPVE